MLIAIYVDDILVACKDPEMIERLGKTLSGRFDIRDLGPINYCLGVKFHRDGQRIIMSQQSYIEELLNRFNMIDAEPIGTPMDTSTKLIRRSESIEMDEDVPYRELVGCLTYLAVTTRPDISFAASCLGQFNNSYGRAH